MTKKTQHSRKLSVKAITTDGDIVRAVISAPVVDLQGELFDTKTMLIPLRDGTQRIGAELGGDERWNVPLVINHDLDMGGINEDVRDTIGSVWNGKLNDDGELEVELKFSSRPIAQEMLTLIIEEHLLDCFSIVAWRGPADNDGVIRYSELVQLGLVWKGANQNARVLEIVAKALGSERNDDVSEVEKKKQELAAKQAEVDALQAEVDEAEKADTEETEAPKETPAPEEKTEEKSDEKAEDTEEEETKAEDANEEEKGKDKVTKSVAAKAAASKPNTEAKQTAKDTAADAHELKKLATKSLVALKRGDMGEVRAIAAKAVENGRGNYADITGEDTDTSFLQAQIDAEAAKLYEDAGGLVARVTRKSLTGNSTEYRKRIKRGRLTYAPAPYGENKKVQHSVPEWFEAKVQPWAVIAAWDEEAAEDAPYDYIDDVTEDLFDGALFNEEFMIMAFAGGTFGGRTYAPTGILPILNTAGNRYTKYVADATFVKTLTTALGKVVSTSRNARFALAMTRTTRASLAGITTTGGKLLFDGGDSVALGLMGSVDIIEVESTIVPDGEIVIGDFSQYIDVQKGGVKILGSQHASLDNVSLYQSDGEAVRGRQRIGGGPIFVEAFYVLGTGNNMAIPAQPAGDAS